LREPEHRQDIRPDADEPDLAFVDFHLPLRQQQGRDAGAIDVLYIAQIDDECVNIRLRKNEEFGLEVAGIARIQPFFLEPEYGRRISLVCGKVHNSSLLDAVRNYRLGSRLGSPRR